MPPHPLHMCLYNILCHISQLCRCKVWSLTQAEFTLLKRTRNYTVNNLGDAYASLWPPTITRNHPYLHPDSLHYFATIPHDFQPRLIFDKLKFPVFSSSYFYFIVELHEVPSTPIILLCQFSKAQSKGQIKQSITVSEFPHEFDYLPLAPASIFLHTLGNSSLTGRLGFPILSKNNCGWNNFYVLSI